MNPRVNVYKKNVENSWGNPFRSNDLQIVDFSIFDIYVNVGWRGTDIYEYMYILTNIIYPWCCVLIEMFT